jgi:predicted transcriptional regulator
MWYSLDMATLESRASFGDWVYDKIDPHDITILQLSDYSGIHIRTLYRILKSETVLRFADWIWLVECVADMTGSDLTETVTDAALHMMQNR